MAETALSNISNYRTPEPPAPRPAGQAEVAAAAPRQAAAVPDKSVVQDNKPARAAETPSAPLVGNSSNVSLQFRVDDKTNDVTVFVVDRQSKKVIRSIPSSELSKLQAGDLLKLTA